MGWTHVNRGLPFQTDVSIWCFVTGWVTVCDGKCYGLNIRKCLITNECYGVTAKNTPSGLEQG